MSEFGRFHAHDGWYFQRHADGTVEVTIEGDANAETNMALNNTFSPAEWASIVAAVGARGNNAEAFAEAGRLHGAAVASPYGVRQTVVDGTVRVEVGRLDDEGGRL